MGPTPGHPICQPSGVVVTGIRDAKWLGGRLQCSGRRHSVNSPKWVMFRSRWNSHNAAKVDPKNTESVCNMKEIQRHLSPDGTLSLVVELGDDAEVCVGFKGSSWHTHPDLLASWFQVPEEQAVQKFIEAIEADQIPIVLSVDGGTTIDVWVSDNLQSTLSYFGHENCVLRYWSGRKTGNAQ